MLTQFPQNDVTFFGTGAFSAELLLIMLLTCTSCPQTSASGNVETALCKENNLHNIRIFKTQIGSG